MDSAMKPIIFRFVLLQIISAVESQICQGELGFEKIANVAAELPSRVLLSGDGNQPVTKDCLALCLQSTDCFGFNLNYTGKECESISVRDGEGFDEKVLVERAKSSFFRKVCNIAVSNSKCNDMPWVIELVLSSFMDKSSADETSEAHNTDDCSNSCLASSVCRSATYNDAEQTCVLHREDRRTRPTAFHTKPNETRLYIENQCSDLKSSNCHYQLSEDTTVTTEDALSNAISQSECEHKCDQDERDLCRSYGYDSSSHLCYLSGDDAISLGVNANHRGGFVYGERKCVPEKCNDGPSAFERVTGRILQSVTTPEGPQPIDLTSDLTIKCLSECQERGTTCVAVIMDYTNFLCQFATERYIGGTFNDFSIATGASYFERVCLTEIPSSCENKAWIFDRVPGSLLEGFDDKILQGVLSRSECEDSCLREKTFICRSAEYTSSIAECRLSREDRRTRPDAFGAKNEAVDYLENQCVTFGRDCTSERKQDAFPTYIDAVRNNVTSEEECSNHCKQTTKFTCRAYGYRSISSECLLSSVDKTAGGPESILPRPETIYVSRECRVMSENIVQLTTFHPAVTFVPEITKPPEIALWGPHSGRCQKGGGIQIYEKTPGFALRLEQISPSMFTGAVPGITAECRGRCDMDPACSGFTQDYLKLNCLFHSVDVLDDAARQRLVHAPSSAYFEVTCIKVMTGCDRLWAFDRLLDKAFIGSVSETHLGISKAACEEACLAEKRFLCRAMTYNRFRGECRMFKDDRFILPQAFVESAGTDYFENQCAGAPFFISPRQEGTCDKTRQQGQFLQYADISTSASSEKECDHLCRISSNFTCRSYSYIPDHNQCLISSVTANEIGMKLMYDKNSVYVERNCTIFRPPSITTLTSSPLSGDGSCTAAGYSMERTVGVAPKTKHKNVLNANTLIGRTKHCIRNCNRVRNNCMAFVQKLGTSCLSFNNPVDRRDLVTSTGTVYFEKVCLRAIGCGKLWIFDRLIGFEFPSNEAKRIHTGVKTRQECQELCLQEVAFVCRSTVYVYSKKECRLYHMNRYTNPISFHSSDKVDIDYMENQCASDS